MEDDFDFLTSIENALANIDIEIERLEFSPSGDKGMLKVFFGKRIFYLEFHDAALLPD